MAVLKKWDLSFEVVFRELDECLWVQYEIYFRWQGEPIFRDELLKRSPSGWVDRPKGALKANEHHGDSLIAVLEKVLDCNEFDYWQPIEPDIVVGFYPDAYFPFMPSHSKIIYEAEHVKTEALAREKQKRENGGKLPDDTITMVAMVDSYNFKDCVAYEGQGPAFIMTPSRENLEQFLSDLKAEWKLFEVEQRLEERIKEYYDDLEF